MHGQNMTCQVVTIYNYVNHDPLCGLLDYGNFLSRETILAKPDIEANLI